MILFQHHHMPVSLNADVLQPQKIMDNSTLAKDMGSQMVIALMLGCLSGEDHNRDPFQADKLRRGFF